MLSWKVYIKVEIYKTIKVFEIQDYKFGPYMK
jgi:hypothetical protein